MTNNNNGGKRPNSGRPKKEQTVTINFRVKARLSEQIKDHVRPIIKKLNE